MKKNLTKTKTKTVAPLIARAQNPSSHEPSEKQRDTIVPWLSKQVAQRLEDGRTLLIDLATDLPFAVVLRGRVAPPREDVLVQAEPMAQMIQRFGPRLPPLSIDETYIRERRALIDRLGSFEKAGENFLGLIRRTRAVVAAQLEKAMRGAFAVASAASASDADLARTLQPMAPVLSGGKPAKR